MRLTTFVVLAIALCAHALDVKEAKETKEVKEVKETDKPADSTANKDKRQTYDEVQPGESYYRTPRKQEPVAPVQEPNNEDKNAYGQNDEEYRPGQVFSLNAQELLDLQPERKAPLPSSQQLQDLYSNTQQEHKQNLQQFFYLEPQVGRQQQVSLQPSHAVIARPSYTSNGGEASVGAALSVADTGASPSDSFEQELFALLGQAPSREETRQQTYQAPQPQSYQAPQQQSYQAPQAQSYQAPQQSYQPQTQSYQAVQAPQLSQVQQVAQVQPVTQNIAAQYQQIDRYLTKPSKKPTKVRSKVQITPPQASIAPQQYLIETTNVQQHQQPIQHQQIQQQQIQQQPIQQQYRQAPQPQRAVQLLRYVPIQPTQQVQQVVYESPEPQGIKVVPAPKLTQPAPEYKIARVQQTAQPQYRYQPQYQQADASPKQYRLIESPRPTLRQEQRISSPSVERPVTYLKRFPDVEKQRAVKIYEQMVGNEGQSAQQPTQQILGEQQYYLRPMYRINDQRARYEYSQLPLRTLDQTKVGEPTKPPASSIYVSKNIAPKKVIRPTIPVKPVQPIQPIQQSIPQEPLRDAYRIDQQANYEQQNYEQSSQYSDQRAHLPPPRNNKAYTPEEFAALVAAGYSVTPIPVGSVPQSRSSAVPIPESSVPQRRILPSRRNQYLPLRSDEAP